MDQIAEFKNFYNAKIHKLEKRIIDLEGNKEGEEEDEDEPKHKLTPQQRLKICIIGQLLLLIAVVVPTVLLANKESTYYRFGPHKDLIVISIKIDNYTRYGVLIVYIMAIRICKVFVNELGMPILGFNIYDPNRKVVKGFTRIELQFQANLMYMMNSISYVFTLQLAIIQLDIAIISVFCSELASIVTINLLLRDKQFVKDSDNDDNAYKIDDLFVQVFKCYCFQSKSKNIQDDLDDDDVLYRSV
jgi:hypothetical protein